MRRLRRTAARRSAVPAGVVRTALVCGVLGILVQARPAAAVLSPSEGAQIKQYVATAQPANAQRVRAFVARPDLSIDESVTAMSEALVPVVFNDARGAFLRDLVFGGASTPSRSVLALAATKGALARASDLLAKHAGDLDQHPEAVGELLKIYAFIDAEIAGTGPKRGLGRDPQTGISLQTYDDCAKALAQHIDKNPKWLKSDAQLSPGATRMRAQAQLALLDLMNESPTWRVDAADRLGLSGARRSFLTELGLLICDSGKATNPQIERVRAVLGRLPAARVDATAIYFGDDKPGVRARGQVLAVKSPLAATGGGALLVNPFPDDVEVGPTDPAASDLARELSLFAVKRALDTRGELRLQADRDVRSVTGDASRLLGKTDATTENALASAVHLLVTDAPRTVDLAFVRFLAQRPEAAAILCDALGVLAAFASNTTSPDGLSLAVGKPRGSDGSTESTLATSVRLAPNGAAQSFTLVGHRWEITRGDSGIVTGIRRDGQPLSLPMLTTARVPVTDAASWQDGGLAFVRLQGQPSGGVAGGNRVRVQGKSDNGFDAIATPAPSDDVVVEADVRVSGNGGGIMVHAVAGKDAIRGVTLLLTPTAGPLHASLRASDESGAEIDLAPGESIPMAPVYRVKISVKGSKVDAVVAGKELHGTLPSGYAKGAVALRAKKGASVEATSFTMKKL
jgi:hypothetical protein